MAANNGTLYIDNLAYVYSNELVLYLTPAILLLFTLLYIVDDIRNDRFMKIKSIWSFRGTAVAMVCVANTSFAVCFMYGSILAVPFHSSEGRITCIFSFIGLGAYSAAMFAVQYGIKELRIKVSLQLLGNRSNAKPPGVTKVIFLILLPVFLIALLIQVALLYTGVMETEIIAVKTQMGMMAGSSIVAVYTIRNWGNNFEDLLSSIIDDLRGAENDASTSQQKTENVAKLRSASQRIKTYNRNFLLQSIFWGPLSLALAVSPILDYTTPLVIFVRWLTPLSFIQLNIVTFYFFHEVKTTKLAMHVENEASNISSSQQGIAIKVDKDDV